MSHPERGTKTEEVPEWEGWTSSGCPRQPLHCGRCCCQRSGLHPPTEERCPMLCSGECGSWAWWSRQRRNSHSFSGHKGYFLKPAQGHLGFLLPVWSVQICLTPAQLLSPRTHKEGASRHPSRFGPAASVPTSYLSFTKPWMEAWPLAPHPQPQSRMEVMLRWDRIRQAANSTWRVPQRSEGTATLNGTKCQSHRHFCWTSPA